jgi:O-antigen/teichoic acid export membrane protein
MHNNSTMAPISTITHNALYLAMYQFLCGLIQFSFFLLLLRIIPQSHMDIFELGRSCLEIGVGIIGSSLAAVIVRENARNQHWWLANSPLIRKLLRNTTLLVGALIYVLVLLSAHTVIHTVVIGSLCLTIYFQSRTELYEAFYRSRDQVKWPVFIGLLCSISVTLITLLCVLYLPNPVLWAAFGILLRYLIQGSILSWRSSTTLSGDEPFHAETRNLSCSDIVKDVAPISVGAIAFIIYARIDVLMLQWMGFEHMIATYSCAFRPLGFLSVFVAAFYLAFAPSISKMIYRDTRKAFWISIRVGLCFSLAGLLFAVGIAAFRQEITALLYPDNFSLTADGLFVLAWTLPIVFGGNAIGFYLVNYGKQGTKYYMIVNIIGVLVNIIGNLYAIPKYNFIGAAWITVLTDFMTTLLMTLAAIKISRIQLSKD